MRLIAQRSLKLLTIGFLADTTFIFVYVVALQTYLPESMHASPAIAGASLSAYGLSKLATQIGSGLVSDVLGGRGAAVLGAALILFSTVLIIPFAIVVPWAIVFAALTQGLGSAILWPAIYKISLSQFSAQERAQFFSVLTIVVGLAVIIGLASGTIIETRVPFEAAMIVPITCTLVGTLLALKLPAAPLTREMTIERLPLRLLVRLLSKRTFVAFTVVEFCVGCSIGAVGAGFRAYGRDLLVVTMSTQLLLLGPSAFVAIAALFRGGVLADRSGPRPLLVGGFLTASISIALLSVASAPLVVVLVSILTGLSFGLAFPSIGAARLSLAGSSSTSPGGALGWFLTSDALGLTVGPLLAAALLDAFGVRYVLIMLSVLYFLIGIISTTLIFQRVEIESAT